MIVYIKYLILILGFFAAFQAMKDNNVSAAIVAAGSFIAYALIEIQDLKIINKEDTTE